MSSDAATITQIVTLATLIVGFVWQWISSGRQRRWDMEDRLALAAKVAADAKQIKDQVVNETAALKVVTAAHVEGIKAAIAENTKKTEKAIDAAHEAYKEANNVNEKISGLQTQLLTETRARRDDQR